MANNLWKKIFFSVLSTLAALWIGIEFLYDTLSHHPFMLLLAAVALSAWFGGSAGGITATLISILAYTYFLAPPLYSFYLSSLEDTILVLLFGTVGIIISLLFESLHKNQKQMAYLAAILESSEDAIIAKNLNGIITAWSAGAERIFGYKAKEAIGKPVTISIPPDRMEEESIILSRLNKGDRLGHYETIRKTKDGRMLDVSISISPVYDRSGRIIGASKIIRDITTQKKMAEQLRAQQEWYQVTLASIGDGVIATDMQARIMFLNPEAQRMTGWDQQEAFNQPLSSVFHILNEDTRQPVVEDPVEKVIKQGKIMGLANHTLLVSRDGTERPIDDYAAPIRLPDGKLLGIVLIFHDLAPHRMMERELQDTADMLMDRDRRKDEFLAMLAHELRNPLAPISNALHIMNSPVISEPIRKEAIKMASRQVSHMVRLLDDLLDVSRITHGKVVLLRKRTDLCEIIESAVETAKSMINERGHTLAMDMPECPIWIDGDPTRLAQLFGNLLNNAAKYTPNGGKIWLHVQENGPEIIISVRDNGIGIQKEKLPYIFDMFMQVDSSLERTQGGLGIGLMLVKNIAELHEGSISVSSEGVGRGTEFTIKLPILEQGQKGQAEEEAMQPEPTSGHYRVLVVDDSEASAKTLGWMIETLGHSVKLAYDSKNALQSAHESKPDVVLLDIGMPDMNGYELCEEMHKDPALKETVFIAQTGWGQEKHLLRSKEAGFDAHLIKPISFDALRDQLEHISKRAA